MYLYVGFHYTRVCYSRLCSVHVCLLSVIFARLNLCLKLNYNILSIGELHLTPIHGAIQLRPSFEYLNKGDANARQNASLTEEGI